MSLVSQGKPVVMASLTAGATVILYCCGRLGTALLSFQDCVVCPELCSQLVAHLCPVPADLLLPLRNQSVGNQMSDGGYPAANYGQSSLWAEISRKC